jgi:hypothetical protein
LCVCNFSFICVTAVGHAPGEWKLNCRQPATAVDVAGSLNTDVTPATLQVKCDDRGVSYITSLPGNDGDDGVSAAERWLRSAATSVCVGWVKCPLTINGQTQDINSANDQNGSTVLVNSQTIGCGSTSNCDPFDTVAWHSNKSALSYAALSNPFRLNSVDVTKSFELKM